MTSEPEVGRHLSRESTRQYLAAGMATMVKLEGAPVCYLVIEPATPRIGLRAAKDGSGLPDLAGYSALDAVDIAWQGGAWSQFSISGDIVGDAFPILNAVADRIQLEGASFAAAVVASLNAARELLAGASKLGIEREIGLFGELLVIEHLLTTRPEAETLSAWRPDGEEHDFDLGHGDLEVKTTTSEQRIHWISSPTQLTATLGRPLWLASLQLTEAGAQGLTLKDLVERVKERLASEVARALFEDKLSASGWKWEAAALYRRRYRLRAPPAFYVLDDAFPALTRSMLDELGVSDRIKELHYRLDLAGLPETAPKLLGTFGAKVDL